LIEQFYNNEGMLTTKKLLKAKEMEKEQIENAWYDGYLYEGRMPDHECVADTYYKKTYGDDKQ